MDLQRRGSRLIFPYIVIFAAIFIPIATAISKECSACSAVAEELQLKLEKEKPKKDIDLRARLDSEGNRYGKVIEFRMSELRVLELLEGLCDSMLEYEFAASPATNDTPAQWQWVKSSESKLVGWTRLDKAEKLTRRKELEFYCARLVEVHEDTISAAVRKPEFTSSDLRPLFCRQLTKACPAETSPVQKPGSDEL
eukprot:jgi/Botrbrau1/23097/Bobra.0243s0034.1